MEYNQNDIPDILNTPQMFPWSNDENSQIPLYDPLEQSSSPSEMTDQLSENSNKSVSACKKNVKSETKRKREREIKNKHEKKRRNRYYEQMDTLRSLFYDVQNTEDQPKLTRELVLETAIHEILNLRKELHETKHLLAEANANLKSASVVVDSVNWNWSESSLSDPMNRASYPMQELERVFESTYARETVRFFDVNEKRTEKMILETAKMLEAMANQIGKLSYQLSAGNFEMLFHCCIKSNTREMRRCLNKNWELYQTGVKAKNAAQDNFLLLLGGDAGTVTLTCMSIFEYVSGNMEAAERTFGFAKQLCKKLSHTATNHFMLSTVAWGLRGMTSISSAQKIKQSLQKDFFWAPLGTVIEGRSLIANGMHKEGLEAVEQGVGLYIERLGDAADVFLAPILLDSYIQTRSVDKGISMANYLYNKCTVLNIESMTGKAAILRKKANLLILKKYPEFIPEVCCRQPIEPSPIQDILNLPEFPSSSTIQMEDEITSPNAKFNPLASSVVRNLATISDCDDIETLLRSAMKLAHSRELYTAELWCGIDLARYFVHCGDTQQAMETAQLVKHSLALLKGTEGSRELKRARMVISSIEESNFLAQVL